MKAELLNEIIQYLMGKPYREVYTLMDKIRQAVEEVNTPPTVEGEKEEMDG